MIVKELNKMSRVAPIGAVKSAPEVGRHVPPAARLTTNKEEGEG